MRKPVVEIGQGERICQMSDIRRGFAGGGSLVRKNEDREVWKSCRFCGCFEVTEENGASVGTDRDGDQCIEIGKFGGFGEGLHIGTFSRERECESERIERNIGFGSKVADTEVMARQDWRDKTSLFFCRKPGEDVGGDEYL